MHPAFRERLGRVAFETWLSRVPFTIVDRWEDLREAWRSVG
jgi:hypothetical protein